MRPKQLVTDRRIGQAVDICETAKTDGDIPGEFHAPTRSSGAPTPSAIPAGPTSESWFHHRFDTHPHISQRIAVLQQIKHGHAA
jgi:Zn-dependent protease with chaperone function